MSVLSSILGMVVLIAIAVLLSNNRKAISIRTVVGALAIQVGFAALILYVPAGKQALGAAADMVSNVILDDKYLAHQTKFHLVLALVAHRSI